MSKNGYFVISLDFELVWGVFDVVNYKEKEVYFQNTRLVIPKILKRFGDYNIKATWAIVGMLFNDDWQEWYSNRPEKLPDYQNENLSAYKFGDSINSEGKELLVFSKDLIRKIKETKGQEIGTHTYSHYYSLEKGQGPKEFRADLLKAIEVAKKENIEIKTLIFPRNQLNEEYLRICYDLGIENVRSNPASWYWRDTLSNSLLNKVARTGDAYLPFGKKSYFFNKNEIQSNFPMEQKASRFLRPVEENFIFRRLKLRRIKNEIERAAKCNEIYHLWWHPHNFGNHPEESLKDLDEILDHVKLCKEKYGLSSVNMQDINRLYSI